MRFLSKAKLGSFLFVAFIPIVTALAGTTLASSTPAGSHPGTSAVAPEFRTGAVPPVRDHARPRTRTRKFPDAATLQSLAVAGQIESTRLLSGVELAALQCRIDRFNVLWDMTTRRLHQHMALVTERMIERGELQPSFAVERHKGDALIGRQLTVYQGVPYEKAFYAGDDEEVDQLQRRIEILTRSFDNSVRSAFGIAVTTLNAQLPGASPRPAPERQDIQTNPGDDCLCSADATYHAGGTSCNGTYGISWSRDRDGICHHNGCPAGRSCRGTFTMNATGGCASLTATVDSGNGFPETFGGSPEGWSAGPENYNLDCGESLFVLWSLSGTSHELTCVMCDE